MRQSNGGQLIIICLCAGMLCGGAFAFASVPAAAVAFIGPICIGSAIAIGRASTHQHVLVAVLLAAYTCILVRGVFVVATQLVNRMVAQSEVEKQVRKDALTGLGNRLYLDEALDAAVSGVVDRGEQFALLYLDLDEFKSVNDTFGHAIGDKLLAAVATRLRASTRASDILTRLGGDEFGLLAANLESAQQAGAIATTILKALEPPFFLAGSSIPVSASVGIAIAPLDGVDSRDAPQAC